MIKDSSFLRIRQDGFIAGFRPSACAPAGVGRKTRDGMIGSACYEDRVGVEVVMVGERLWAVVLWTSRREDVGETCGRGRKSRFMASAPRGLAVSTHATEGLADQACRTEDKERAETAKSYHDLGNGKSVRSKATDSARVKRLSAKASIQRWKMEKVK